MARLGHGRGEARWRIAGSRCRRRRNRGKRSDGCTREKATRRNKAATRLDHSSGAATAVQRQGEAAWRGRDGDACARVRQRAGVAKGGRRVRQVGPTCRCPEEEGGGLDYKRGNWVGLAQPGREEGRMGGEIGRPGEGEELGRGGLGHREGKEKEEEWPEGGDGDFEHGLDRGSGNLRTTHLFA
uniref:Uncharacterized protein n=1 Tax=Oryza brachyantha TaxID=4533 RepID=J3N287_ORYBR